MKTKEEVERSYVEIEGGFFLHLLIEIFSLFRKWK